EARLFEAIDPDATAAVPEVLRAVFGPRAEEVLAVYRSRHGEDAPTAAMTAERYRVPTVRVAERQARHAAVWAYRFDWEDPALGRLGAAHGSELPLLLEDAANPLAERMQAAWIAFVRGASPGWPEYSEPDRLTMIFDAE